MLQEEEEEAAAGAEEEQEEEEDRGTTSSRKLSRKAQDLEDKAAATSRRKLASTTPSQSSQSSVESYSLSPLDDATAAADAGVEAVTADAGVEAVTVDDSAGTRAALSSQDCFPTSGSLPGGTRDGDFLAANGLPSKLSRRSSTDRKFKCCAQCGHMANSNRSKTCAACGCLEFVPQSKLSCKLNAAAVAAAVAEPAAPADEDAADADATHDTCTATIENTANAVEAGAGTSSSTRTSSVAVPAAGACPFCVAGSGKVVGHRGAHKRSLSKCGLIFILALFLHALFFLLYMVICVAGRTAERSGDGHAGMQQR
jgi:ribosomal protein L37E